MSNVERAVRELLTEHQEWLADNTFVDQIDGDWVEITTPFLDTSNDAVQSYARLIGDDKILLTVRRWLDDHGVRYSVQVTMIGKTGYYHVFNFLIPLSDAASERLVQTISRLDKQAVEHTVFSWSDVQPSRPDTQAFPVVNDETAPTAHSERALTAFGVETILWSDREAQAHLLSE